MKKSSEGTLYVDYAGGQFESNYMGTSGEGKIMGPRGLADILIFSRRHNMTLSMTDEAREARKREGRTSWRSW